MSRDRLNAGCVVCPLVPGMVRSAHAAYTGLNTIQIQVHSGFPMRPLFAIVPLLGLLLWFGEPVTDTPAGSGAAGVMHPAPTAASSVATAPAPRAVQATDVARGTLGAHTLPTTWRAAR